MPGGLTVGLAGRAVRVVEVGARDGLQAEAGPRIATAVKVELLRRLARAGLRDLEAGAFVSPKAVPQMADSAAVLAAARRDPLLRRDAGVRLPVLVPNARGLEAALAAGASEVAVFPAASEGFSRRNLNCSVRDGLAKSRQVAEAALAHGLRVRGYISCIAGCPYDGAVAPAAVAAVAAELHAMGCYEVSLGDTIGVGTPRAVGAVVEAVLGAGVPATALAVHFHDTYGQGLANILQALTLGVQSVDAAVAGLGGCPYAPGATGNVATEDVVYMLDGLGVETGVDLEGVVAAGEYIMAHLGRPTASRAGAALRARAAAAAEGASG